MSAAAAMIATDTVERYPSRSQEDKARLVRAEVQLISRFLRANLVSVSWRCHVCGGRVDIHGRTVIKGRAQVTATRGQCRTAGCLHWED